MPAVSGEQSFWTQRDVALASAWQQDIFLLGESQASFRIGEAVVLQHSVAGGQETIKKKMQFVLSVAV
jgi:hypothetical protein